MEAKDAVKAILKSRKMAVMQLARQIGEVQQYTDRKLRGDMKASYMVRVCDALGYEVVIRPKRAGRKEDGAYILGADDE